MKNLVITSLLVLTSYLSFAQKNYVHVSAGPSFHGSGDLTGYHATAGFGRQLHKSFGFEVNLTNTSHSRESVTNLTKMNLEPAQFTYRFLTTGTQLDLLLRFPIVNRGYKLAIVAGGFGRVQKSTTPTVLFMSAYNPCNLMNVQVDFRGRPFTSYNVGYSIELENSVRIYKNLDFGFKVGFQNDTGGNIMPRVPILFRYNFVR